MHDILVIGGGVNGCGVARDAAGRGLKVVLVEKGDLASGASSASTKLIHGGLRYLEYGAFRLVREALREREVLWRNAPHIIHPLRFVLPLHQGMRPAWELRLGLFVYDHLGGRHMLPATRTLNLARDPAGAALRPGHERGYEYSDCWVDDARLVALNAVDARERGANILTHSRAVRAWRDGGGWRVTVENGDGQHELAARAVVNAAGPWVSEVLDSVFGLHPQAHVRMVQGSHIVVPKLFEHDRCYIFQNPDNRIVFAIPYEGDFTLIGTTDRDWHEHPDAVRVSDEEIAYLCAAANEYFNRQIGPGDVVWSYSGIRPLYDDGARAAQAATRDYVLALDEGAGGEPPLINVFGGKITTYRRLASEVMRMLAHRLPSAGGSDWTQDAPLPGGDFSKTGHPIENMKEFILTLGETWPQIDVALLARLARAYGRRADQILARATTIDDLGEHFGAGLYWREVAYLIDNEFARTAEDVLWRRSKLGLRLTKPQSARLEAAMAASFNSRMA